jgi:uncharacterized membrane protein
MFNGVPTGTAMILFFGHNINQSESLLRKGELNLAFLLPLVFLLLLPLLFFLFYFQVAAFSLTRLGFSPEGAVMFFALCLIGGLVNIPVSRRRTVFTHRAVFGLPFLSYYQPQARQQIIAVNLGGAVLPGLFSLYLLGRAPLAATIVATLVVTLVAKKLARPVPGVGIALPAFIPPLAAAAAAVLLAGDNAAPVAYISGVWGTLIGADLLNWPRFKYLGTLVLSIGGAGVFDGIFLVGIVAALLT